MLRTCVGLASVAAGFTLGVATHSEDVSAQVTRIADVDRVRERLTPLPSRDECVERLKSPSSKFDVLVIGGGATGSGIALDAAVRGLNVALVEQADFSAGTSSRSTKLIHGGVRYLEAAFKKLDYGQLTLVFEALHERTTFLEIAPHLSKPLPIMTPCYQWWEAPYYWVGMKMYDAIAGSHKLYGLKSRFVPAAESLRQFPMLHKEGLKGGIVYYDGQMNDSRMCVSIVLTAARQGAAVANHVRVVSLIKNEAGVVTGANVRDELSGDEWPIQARAVVNATGPFCDAVCRMDNPNHADLIVPSAGIHVVLPDYYSPDDMGMIIPKTKDGRVVFMLPWEGWTVAGTTDQKTEIKMRPQPGKEEVDFILESISEYLQVAVRQEDVQSTWAGIRPLARDPTAKDTSQLSRNHVIVTSPSGLVTITGGKWTTYRRMAEECVDTVLANHPALNAKASPCATHTTKLIGAEDWDPAFYTVLTQEFKRKRYARDGSLLESPMDTECAKHLSHNYGDRSVLVASHGEEGYGKRLSHNHPFLEAEVVHAVKQEMACTVVDVIGHRTRLAFVDTQAANYAIPRIASIMQELLGWDSERKKAEIEDAHAFLDSFSAVRTASGEANI